jgi:hypothetical protein
MIIADFFNFRSEFTTIVTDNCSEQSLQYLKSMKVFHILKKPYAFCSLENYDAIMRRDGDALRTAQRFHPHIPNARRQYVIEKDNKDSNSKYKKDKSLKQIEPFNHQISVSMPRYH